jgi:hypothetical protein
MVLKSKPINMRLDYTCSSASEAVHLLAGKAFSNIARHYYKMKLLPATISILLLAMSFPIVAQDGVHPDLRSKYSLNLGMFFPEREIRLQAGVTPGARGIDFKSEFGLKKHDDEFAFDFKWRFGEKWSLAAQHFSASAAATAMLDFSRGTSVEASSEFALYRAFLGRSFAKTDNVDFGVGAGIHWLDVGAAIAGNLLVNNTVTFRREKVNSSAPLPNIGAWYDYSLSPRWAIKARADWFKASVGKYDGRLVNFQAGINYSWFEYGGIGVAYNHFEFDAGITGDNWRGTADLVYKGPVAFVNIYW